MAEVDILNMAKILEKTQNAHHSTNTDTTNTSKNSTISNSTTDINISENNSDEIQNTGILIIVSIRY